MPYILLHTYAIYIPYGYLYYLYNCYTTYGINNDFMYCGLFILVTRPFFYNGPQCAIGVRQNYWTQQHTFYQHIHCRIESIMFSVFDQPTNPGTYSRRERVAACFFFHGSEVCYLHIVQKVTWYVKWISTLTSSRQFQCKIQIQMLTHFLIWFSIYTPSLWGCFSDCLSCYLLSISYAVFVQTLIFPAPHLPDIVDMLGDHEHLPSVCRKEDSACR